MRRAAAGFMAGLAVLAGIGCSKGTERSQAAYCGELRRLRPSLQPPPDAPLDRVYADAASAFDRLEGRAPEENRRDVARMTRALHEMADLTAAAGGDPVRTDSRRLVEVALANKDANDRVNAYNKDRCGVDTAAATSP